MIHTADDFKWRISVSEARTELRHEIGLNFAFLDERISEQRCAEQRLKALAVIITRASETGRLPPLGSIATVKSYTWPTAAWETNVAAETMVHFPTEQNAALSRAYRFISLIRKLNDSEVTAWQTLNTMVGPGRPVDAASISRLIEAKIVARSENANIAYQKQTIEKILLAGGLGKDFPQLDPRNPPVLSRSHWICDPIGKPGATY